MNINHLILAFLAALASTSTFLAEGITAIPGSAAHCPPAAPARKITPNAAEEARQLQSQIR